MHRRQFLFALIGMSPLAADPQGPFYAGDSVTYDPNTIDKTLPDGFEIRQRQTKVKKWLVRNNGSVRWRDRFLSRQDDPSDPTAGFISDKWSPLPNTGPGHRCIMGVAITAPEQIGRCQTFWKQVELLDPRGRRVTHGRFKRMTLRQRDQLTERLMFPGLSGVYALGTVVPR